MSLPEPADMSHAMLIALLMHLGGSYDLPSSALTEADVFGTSDGALHALELVPLRDGRVRLSVVPRPPGDGAGIEIRDAE
ncbi:hypothetical protein AB0H49_34405 [Nocardia sp. NPDC050713]|uniref:hypothetical protein n=1 Tax=Nocardia sp. NPDC050713 TaxID=3154511 RepID=UPI003401298A